jgi:hypothetical protein
MKEKIMKSRKIIFTTVLSALVCFGLLPGANAQGPEAPDTALAGGNTADGQSALAGLTTGIYNSAFGIYALLSNGAANFNTGVGAGVLLSDNSTGANLGNENTAAGAGALFSNIDGDSNTAVGAFALFNENATGGFPNGVSNNAIGRDAMLFNVSGSFNEAIGVNALASNTSGSGNIAIGDDAGCNITGGGNVTVGGGSCASGVGITSGSNNTVVGTGAGAGVTVANNNVLLGAGTGSDINTDNANVYIGLGVNPPDPGPFESNTIRIGGGVSGQAVLTPGTASCFIDGITENVIPMLAGQPIVAVLPTGQLVQTTDFSAFKVEEQEKKIAKQQKKIEEQQASITELKNQVQIMVAQLKEQAAEIQKVSAQLQVSKPAPRVVANKP